jgi:hypothetical protein
MSPNDIRTDKLSQGCREESERYRRSRSNDQGHCFELFRRAIVENNEEAWSAIHAQYWKLVAKWVNGPTDRVDERVNIAFSKFWGSVPANDFRRNFASIGKVMAYLQMCAHSVKVDEGRPLAKEGVLSDLEELVLGEEDTMLIALGDKLQTKALFDYIKEERLKNKQEELLFYLSFQIGLKPKQIAQQYPNDFATLKEVRRIKERIILRLRSDPQIARLWKG